MIVVSLGERPWWPITLRWLEHYCARWNHDLVVVRQPLVADLKPEDFDRFQNYGRAQKLGIGPFFELYDRIIQVDDTCIISPATPNMAEIVPESTIGSWIAGRYFSDIAFSNYANYHAGIYQRATPLPKERFYNSGLTVYSKKHALLFERSNIPWDKIKADRERPQQGYLSHRCEEAGFELHDLGPNFNFVGSRIKRAGDISRIAEDVFVFHVTSAIRDRLDVATQIDRLFRMRYSDEAPAVT
jgi:hypothetical protein